jgi:hypothetical protein
MDPRFRVRAAEARRYVATRDPELLTAAAEVDRSLLSWSLAQSPRQRLDACTNAARALGRFRRAAPEDR